MSLHCDQVSNMSKMKLQPKHCGSNNIMPGKSYRTPYNSLTVK